MFGGGRLWEVAGVGGVPNILAPALMFFTRLGSLEENRAWQLCSGQLWTCSGTGTTWSPRYGDAEELLGSGVQGKIVAEDIKWRLLANT